MCADTGGSGQSRVGNVTVQSVEAYAVTLSWTVTDVTATRFRILYSSDLDVAAPVLSQVAPPSNPGLLMHLALPP